MFPTSRLTRMEPQQIDKGNPVNWDVPAEKMSRKPLGCERFSGLVRLLQKHDVHCIVMMWQWRTREPQFSKMRCSSLHPPSQTINLLCLHEKRMLQQKLQGNNSKVHWRTFPSSCVTKNHDPKSMKIATKYGHGRRGLENRFHSIPILKKKAAFGLILICAVHRTVRFGSMNS